MVDNLFDNFIKGIYTLLFAWCLVNNIKKIEEVIKASPTLAALPSAKQSTIQIFTFILINKTWNV